MAERDLGEDARTSSLLLTDLTVGFGNDPVLQDVSLRVEAGLTLLIGTNGAGKSTLLRTVATALRPLGGSYSLNGEAIVGRSAVRTARRRIGYVPQQPDFPGNFTVAEFLAYGARLKRASSTDIDRCVDRLDIGTFLCKQLSKLSGGQRQRCYIAEALLHEPVLLLLDEPTAGLDIPSRERFIADIEALSTNRIVMMTTHLVEDVSARSAYIVLVNDGLVEPIGYGCQVASAALEQNQSVGAYLSGLFVVRD